MKKQLGIVSIVAGALGIVAGGLTIAAGILALLDVKHHLLPEGEGCCKTK